MPDGESLDALIALLTLLFSIWEIAMFGVGFLIHQKVSCVVPFLAYCVALVPFLSLSSPRDGRQTFPRWSNFLPGKFSSRGVNTMDWIQRHSFFALGLQWLYREASKDLGHLLWHFQFS